MKTTVLRDGDILAYKAAAVHQSTLEFGEGEGGAVIGNMGAAIKHCRNHLTHLMDKLDGDDLIVCLSDDDVNFRKAILSSYKGHRQQEKPVLLYRLKEWLRKNYQTKTVPTLEADDVMGIYSTHPKLIKGRKVIVSEDKDMQTIPGWWFNPDKHTKPVRVTQDDADAFHYYQTLVGDPTDNYKGCPGVGHVAATKALLADTSWSTVVRVYEDRSLSEDDALVQARCARILRYTDFNYKTKEVIPWHP